MWPGAEDSNGSTATGACCYLWEAAALNLCTEILAVLYYRSWWDWSGIGVGWVPTLPSQTPTIHPLQFFWLIIVSVPKINPISYNIKTSMVGLGGMEWDWVGWMSHNVFFAKFDIPGNVHLVPILKVCRLGYIHRFSFICERWDLVGWMIDIGRRKVKVVLHRTA